MNALLKFLHHAEYLAKVFGWFVSTVRSGINNFPRHVPFKEEGDKPAAETAEKQ